MGVSVINRSGTIDGQDPAAIRLVKVTTAIRNRRDESHQRVRRSGGGETLFSWIIRRVLIGFGQNNLRWDRTKEGFNIHDKSRYNY